VRDDQQELSPLGVGVFLSSDERPNMLKSQESDEIAELLPSRLAAITRGTGEVDCVYHVAFDELVIATERRRIRTSAGFWMSSLRKSV
jgi:hypothetical protein